MKHFYFLEFVSVVALCSLTCHGQVKNSPQLESSDVFRTSFVWQDILDNDNTGLKRIGIIADPRKGTENNPFWSIDCGTLDRNYAKFSSYRPFLSDLGAGYSRLQSGWARTERVKGQYDFEWLDEHIEGVIAEGLTPWLVLSYANPLYSDAGMMLHGELPSGQEELEAWEKYVEAVVQRYKGKISMYEVWNEPNHHRSLMTKESRAKRFNDYNELTLRTINAIRKYDKTVGIAAGSFLYVETEFALQIVDFLKKKGIANELGYMTFHPYTKAAPESKYDEIVFLKESLAKEAPWIQLLQGEVGRRSATDPFQNDFVSTEYIQVKWILRQMAMEFSLDIPCSIFTITDNRYPNKLQSFGMLAGDLFNRVLYKRPSYYGFQHMASLIDKNVSVGPVFDVKAKTSGKFRNASLSKNGRVSGILLWIENEQPVNSLEKDGIDVVIPGLSLNNPVYVDLITGRVFELGKYKKSSKGMKFSKLPLWDAPIAIVEADSFLWKKDDRQ